MARRRLLLLPSVAVALGMLLATLAVGVATGGMGCHAGIERDADETQVRLVSSCTDPLVARVPVGGVVTFTNDDTFPHAVTGAANAWGTYDELNSGQSVAYRFTSSGVFPYFCYIHPGMIGAIVVGDGSPGEGGSSVQRAASSAGTQAAATLAPTPRPTPQPTAAPTASLAAAAAAPMVPPPTDSGNASLSAPTSLLMIALLTVLLAAGVAYGFGLLPGRRTRRANPQ